MNIVVAEMCVLTLILVGLFAVYIYINNQPRVEGFNNNSSQGSNTLSTLGNTVAINQDTMNLKATHVKSNDTTSRTVNSDLVNCRNLDGDNIKSKNLRSDEGVIARLGVDKARANQIEAGHVEATRVDGINVKGKIEGDTCGLVLGKDKCDTYDSGESRALAKGNGHLVLNYDNDFKNVLINGNRIDANGKLRVKESIEVPSIKIGNYWLYENGTSLVVGKERERNMVDSKDVADVRNPEIIPYLVLDPERNAWLPYKDIETAGYNPYYNYHSDNNEFKYFNYPLEDLWGKHLPSRN